MREGIAQFRVISFCFIFLKGVDEKKMNNFNFRKCDFCKHHKNKSTVCLTCQKHNKFSLKTNLHPTLAYEWNKLNSYNRLTNSEAADILIMLLNNNIARQGRGCGKSMTILRISEALSKAIYLLKNTPDK